MKKDELFHTRQAWQHYIGGYYNDTDKFVAEGQKYGVSRRAPAQAIRGMQFGDRLIFLRYGGKDKVFAFAEGSITGLTMDHEVAKELGDKLQQEGKAEYRDGGGPQEIQRECGSYSVGGTWVVTAPLSDCIEEALKTAAEKDMKPLFVMINASLTKVYDQPVYLQPAPKFNRGFTRVSDDQIFISDYEPEESLIVGISGYTKAKRKPKSRPLPLLPEPSV